MVKKTMSNKKMNEELEIVKQIGLALNYVKEQTPELVKAAMKEWGHRFLETPEFKQQ